MRTAHQLDYVTPTNQQRSCNRCVRRKLKCDRNLPCAACAQSKTAGPCEYPSIDELYDPGFQPEFQIVEPGHDHSIENPPTGKKPRRKKKGNNATSSAQDEQSDFIMRSAQTDQSDFSTTSPETYSTFGQPVDPLLLEADDFSPIFSSEPAFTEENAMFGSSLNNGVQFDFRCSGFNWLDFDAPDVELAINHVVSEVGNPTSDVFSGLAPDNHAPPMSGTQQRASILPWPFEHGHDAGTTRCHLPPLREVLQESLQASPGAQVSALEGLVQVLSEKNLPRPDDVADPTILMGIHLLKKLLDVYFANFQLIQPIFHIPTWSSEDCPTMLLAAMACLGAVLSSEPNAAELSSSISDFCNPIISWMGASDTANYSDTSYLASLCLHQIYSLGSGNRQLYQNADRTRGVLFGSLRGLGLLKTRPSVQGDIDMNSPYFIPTNQASLDADWLAWASREREVRIAWASFEYDCSLCTLTSRRGAVDVSELPPKLPCMDALWEAPSSYAWAALKSRMIPNALGVSVSSVISAAIAGTPILENISTWGKRLCGQVIGRLLWDLKQLELVSTTEYFGLSSLSTGQKQSKESLLEALNRLLETMNNPIYTADLVSYNISSLLCHYSHLYTADDIMDMIIYIVHSVVSRGSGQDPGVSMARRRLVSAFENDPRRARKLVWHAGQIVAVANEYLVSAPCEIMRLFMSYIFIVAFAQHYPRLERPATTFKVRLDVPNHHPDQMQAVEEWIQFGGRARIGSAEDILADGAVKTIVQDAQAMLQRLRSWGLAEKFAKILQSFENSGGY